MKHYKNIPEDILELLPWHVTDKLSPKDRIHFDNALETYSELTGEIEEEKQLITQVLADKSILNKRIIEAPNDRLEKVFNKIDNQNKLNNVVSLVEKLKDNYDTKTSKSNTVNTYARVASIGILVISLATLSAFLTTPNTETSDFIPASAEIQPNNSPETESNSIEATILVGFSGTAEELKANKSLNGKQIAIQSAPDNESIYQINFNQAMNADEIQKIIDSLQAQEDSVWFAGEAY